LPNSKFFKNRPILRDAVDFSSRRRAALFSAMFVFLKIPVRAAKIKGPTAVSSKFCGKNAKKSPTRRNFAATKSDANAVP